MGRLRRGILAAAIVGPLLGTSACSSHHVAAVDGMSVPDQRTDTAVQGYLRGAGAPVLKMHAEAKKLASAVTIGNCDAAVAALSKDGTPGVLWQAASGIPDSIAQQLASDELSALEKAVAGCAATTSTASIKAAAAEFTARLNQLGVHQ